MTQCLLPIILFVLVLPRVLCCSCVPSNFRADYYNSIKAGTPISLVKVLSKTIRNDSSNESLFPQNKKVVYKLHVKYVFTNCQPRRSYIAFATSYVSGSLCGIRLELGSTYLLDLKIGARKMTSISLCGVNVLIRSPKRSIGSSLTTEQRRFLLTRRFCCRRRCKCAFGGRTFFKKCLGTRCEYSKKPCAEATKCITNSCDGCNAEWFTKQDVPACLPDTFDFAAKPSQFFLMNLQKFNVYSP